VRSEPRTEAVDETLPAVSLGLAGAATKIVRQLAIDCGCASLISGLLLLRQDVAPGLRGFVRHRWLAAGALLFAGTACLEANLPAEHLARSM
jgi:hypothetical protein